MTEFDALTNNTRRLFGFMFNQPDHIPWYYKQQPNSNHPKGPLLYAMSCSINAQTYLSAYEDIHQYYQIRFLYVNNEDYEIGYLVHEIISRYQMMLEIYQIIVRRYYYAQNMNFAPTTYMMYMYANILEYGMMVVHLCNMLHEIPKKYENKKILSVFDNLDRTSKPPQGRKPTRATVIRPSYEQRVVDIQEQLESERKQRQREQRRERNKAMKENNWKPPAVDRKQKKSHFPLHYGWSIEYW